MLSRFFSTLGRFHRRFLSLGRDESGQTMTEYIFLIVLVGLVCIPLARSLPDAVRGYVRPFYYCVSRPIP